MILAQPQPSLHLVVVVGVDDAHMSLISDVDEYDASEVGKVIPMFIYLQKKNILKAFDKRQSRSAGKSFSNF